VVLYEIWPYSAEFVQSALVEIWPNRPYTKFGSIRPSWPDPNLTASSWVSPK